MSKVSQSHELWLVKFESGQTKGPFTTMAINKMLSKGTMSGHEEVSAYQDGPWQPLEKIPDFFESLLDSLENPTTRDEVKAKKMDAETVITKVDDLKSDEKKEKLNFKSTSVLVQNQKIVSTENLNSYSKNTATDSSPLSLIEARDEILNKQSLKFKINQLKERKKLIWFLGLLLTMIVFVVLYFDNSNTTSRWELKAIPEGKLKSLSSEDVKKLKTSAIQKIRSGKYEEIYKSQVELIDSLQGSINDLESLGLLCYVYQTIWPYSKQSHLDLKAVMKAAQVSRSLLVSSSYSEFCSAALLSVKGHQKDALGLIEKVLDGNANQFILSPFLYFMKAEILEDSKSFIQSEAYYSEALKTFPNWQLAEIGVARNLLNQEKYKESFTAYDKILKSDKSSKSALYGLALTQYFLNSSDKKALISFEQAFELQQVIPKSFHLKALIEYANLLMKNNENKKAIQVIKTALKLSPSHQKLKEMLISLGANAPTGDEATELNYLGDQFFRNEDYLAAQAQYKAAFDLEPKNALLAMKVAKSLWNIYQSKEAIVWIDKAIKIDPKLFMAYYLKAEYLSEKFMFVEALSFLNASLKSHPNTFEILKGLSLVEFRKNNFPLAIRYAEKAMKLYDYDAELIAILGKAYIQMFLGIDDLEENQEKKNQYKALADKYSSLAVDVEPTWPEAHLVYIKFIQAAKGSDIAENMLKEIIKVFPYSFEYRIGLAEFYENLERYKAASEIYSKIVEADPKNKKALIGLARSLQFTNDIAAARIYFLKASLIDPSDVEPIFYVAKLDLEQPNTKDSKSFKVSLENAKKKFQLIKDLNPNYPLISYFQAKVSYLEEDYDSAQKWLDEEKKKNPSLADPYILNSDVHLKKQEFALCADEISKAIELRPQVTENYIKAAVCYRLADQIENAINIIEVAKEKESGYATIYRELGFISEVKNDKFEAVRNFKLYLSLSPNAIDKNLISQKIISLGGTLE